MSRPRPARRNARAQQPRVLRLLPRDSDRRRASLRFAREAGLALEAAAGTSDPPTGGQNDVRHFVVTYSHFCLFQIYVGTSCPRQRSVGLEGADGPVGFEPVTEKCDVVLDATLFAPRLRAEKPRLSPV